MSENLLVIQPSSFCITVVRLKHQHDESTAELCVCFGRCGLPSVPEGVRGGEAVQRGVTAERGEEHPEERRQPADGSAAAAAEPDARGQEAKVSSEGSYLFIKLQRRLVN